MKKLLSFLLVCILAFTCIACNQEIVPETTQCNILPVGNPLAYPDYTFDTEPDTDMLRQTAVQAMRDLLSIEWTPTQGISYYNTAGRDKQFDYLPNTIYGGLLYSGAGSGLFQFLEYYDLETGYLNYPGTGDELQKAIGSGCTDALLWSWGTVANSFSSGYYPSVLVQKNGYLPVGDYTYDPNVKSFYVLPTKDIIASNGEKLMLECYTKVLPADTFISSSADHTMMVVEAPHVEYNADGTINVDASFVHIQDQRGGRGSDTFYEERVSDYTVFYNSQRYMKITFAELLKKNYIPITLAEFIGTKKYEKAYVTTQGKVCEKFKDLQNVMIESNYPLAFISAIVVDKDGNETELDKILFHGANGDGPPTMYNLSQWEKLHTFNTEGYKRLRLEVVVSTGERFIPVIIVF